MSGLTYRAVVLNRVAAEPLGAAKSSRGAANFRTCPLFTSVLCRQIVKNQGRVPQIKKG